MFHRSPSSAFSPLAKVGVWQPQSPPHHLLLSSPVCTTCPFLSPTPHPPTAKGKPGGMSHRRMQTFFSASVFQDVWAQFRIVGLQAPALRSLFVNTPSCATVLQNAVGRYCESLLSGCGCRSTQYRFLLVVLFLSLLLSDDTAPLRHIACCERQPPRPLLTTRENALHPHHSPHDSVTGP